MGRNVSHMGLRMRTTQSEFPRPDILSAPLGAYCSEQKGDDQRVRSSKATALLLRPPTHPSPPPFSSSSPAFQSSWHSGACAVASFMRCRRCSDQEKLLLLGQIALGAEEAAVDVDEVDQAVGGLLQRGTDREGRPRQHVNGRQPVQREGTLHGGRPVTTIHAVHRWGVERARGTHGRCARKARNREI